MAISKERREREQAAQKLQNRKQGVPEKEKTARTTREGDGFNCVPMAATFLTDEAVKYEDFTNYKADFQAWSEEKEGDGISVRKFKSYMWKTFDKPLMQEVTLSGHDPKRTYQDMITHLVCRNHQKTSRFMIFGYTKQRHEDTGKYKKSELFHCAAVDMAHDLFYDAYHYPNDQGTKGIKECLKSFRSVRFVLRFERREYKVEKKVEKKVENYKQ